MLKKTLPSWSFMGGFCRLNVLVHSAYPPCFWRKQQREGSPRMSLEASCAERPWLRNLWLRRLSRKRWIPCSQGQVKLHSWNQSPTLWIAALTRLPNEVLWYNLDICMSACLYVHMFLTTFMYNLCCLRTSMLNFFSFVLFSILSTISFESSSG